MPWRREWLPTPTFLPRKSDGERSLAGYCPGGGKELDMTKRLTHFLPVAYARLWSKRSPGEGGMGTEGCGHFWVRADLGVGLGKEGRWVGRGFLWKVLGRPVPVVGLLQTPLEGGPFVEPWQWLREAWRGLQLRCSLGSRGLTGSGRPLGTTLPWKGGGMHTWILSDLEETGSRERVIRLRRSKNF